MPIHDWTRVDAGLFHDFHQGWTVALQNALNAGILPSDYFSLVEKRIQGPIPNLVPLKLASDPLGKYSGNSGVAVATAPPRTRLIRRKEAEIYAGKANLVTVRHRHGDVVAVIEIVSPGNKGSRAEFRSFVEKTTDLLRHGIHLLVIDLFPPGPRDPQGIHKAIWDEFGDEDSSLPSDKRLTLAAYDAGPDFVADVDTIAVGDAIPDMSLFLRPGVYVPCPLGPTYESTWAAFPTALKGLLEARPI
jgi:hypothetical protein